MAREEEVPERPAGVAAPTPDAPAGAAATVLPAPVLMAGGGGGEEEAGERPLLNAEQHAVAHENANGASFSTL